MRHALTKGRWSGPRSPDETQTDQNRKKPHLPNGNKSLRSKCVVHIAGKADPSVPRRPQKSTAARGNYGGARPGCIGTARESTESNRLPDIGSERSDPREVSSASHRNDGGAGCREGVVAEETKPHSRVSIGRGACWSRRNAAHNFRWQLYQTENLC